MDPRIEEPNDWVETWPDPRRPMAVMCRSCRNIYPSHLMKRAPSHAERLNGRRGEIATNTCAHCRRRNIGALSPAMLETRLKYDGKTHELLVAQKVAARRRAGVERKRKAGRQRWAAAFAEDTAAVLTAMRKEKARFRARAQHYMKDGPDTAARKQAAAAMIEYCSLLSMMIIAVRLRATEGKAPITPWCEAVYRYPHTARAFKDLVVTLHAAARAYPQAWVAGFPSWWKERERLVAGKAPDGDAHEPAYDREIAPGDIEALHQMARSQWTKRRVGKRVSRAEKILAEIEAEENPPPTAEPVAPRMPYERVEVPADLLFPSRRQTLNLPVADGPTEEEIDAENTAYLRRIGLLKD